MVKVHLMRGGRSSLENSIPAGGAEVEGCEGYRVEATTDGRRDHGAVDRAEA